MTPVLVFDVDGTLTASTGVDDECLIAAWRSVWPAVREISTDWSTYEHSTDEGLTHEIGRRAAGRDVTADEVARVKRCFLDLLGRHVEADVGKCSPIAGVRELLQAIRERGWPVGIASGAWPESGRIKLRAAGIDVESLPATFSHADASGRPVKRPRLIAETLEKLGIAEREWSSRAVYIGDGVWDARAARELGIRFVAMRHDGAHERMHAEGVRTILNNYRDAGGVLGILQRLLASR